MKILANIALVILFVSSGRPEVAAQSETPKSMTGVLSGDYQITYLGIDFSRARFIGSANDWPNGDFIKQYNPQWNAFVAKDIRTDHIIAQTFRVKEKIITYRNDICMTHNDGLDFSMSISRESQNTQFGVDDINSILDAYDFSNMGGVGLMLIVEKFDAFAQEGIIHFTLIDLEKGDVLYQERLSGKPFGDEPRRHWAESVHAVIYYARTIRYKEWKKEYLK